MTRAELLGTAIFLWLGSLLLAAFLLLHPRAALLAARIGGWRAWGGVVGLGALGAAVAGRYPGLWVFPAGLLVLLVLPARCLRSVAPLVVAGMLLLGVGYLWVRTLRPFPRGRPRVRVRCAGKSLRKGGDRRRAVFPGRRALSRRSRGASRFRRNARVARDGKIGSAKMGIAVPVDVEGASET